MYSVKKITHFIGKLVNGDSLVSVKLPQEHWDRQFEKGYWDYLLDTPKNVPVIISLFTEIISEKDDINVLDVGCGNGALVRFLLKSGNTVNYYGTDLSKAAIQSCVSEYPQGKFKICSMEQDPKLDVKFDVIIFSEVLCYGDYLKTLNTHKRYLKPNGKIIISLYQTWRTRFIYLSLRRILRFIDVQCAYDDVKNITWKIKVAVYKNE
jgi:2-polyprenyl-3-methyl-5-hydroxy-6-metoxy-1,4-benzoquinol methylase